ncbi:MAG: 4-alpha-glucanotransferase [Nocardioides sp.]
MTSPDQALLDLAARHRISTDYWDWQGRQVPVNLETLVAVLGGLGVAAATPAEVSAALVDADLREWRRGLPPTVLARQGWTPWVSVHVQDGTGVVVTVELEDGGTRAVRHVDNYVAPREVDGQRVGRATVELPGDLPPGWHVLRAAPDDGPPATAALIVSPARLALPPALEHDRVWGVMTQLYQVRSAASWGLGDLADLAALATWAAGSGADFVLVNPLHAAEPVAPIEASPYLPTTRRFANPAYLRIEDTDEYAALTAGSRAQIDAIGTAARLLNTEDTLDRDTVWAAKRAALALLFEAATPAPAFATWRAGQGPGLERFATWCAGAEVHGLDGDAWPTALAAAGPAAVATFAAEHDERVTFHSWLQWLLARQLADVQRTAKKAGMSVGVVHDLAVGVHPEGADSWGLRDALASGVSVGAPPDQFNQLGQDWSQPPWHPERLAELGYAPFRDLVRALLADAGGLRIDHVIGLFRLWWIPAGGGADQGAYVRYDHEALIGILVLEASRTGAVVIGEDLGVVEPFARDYLRERGLLGTSILWFEWGDNGQLLAPESYRELCLATVTTHDLPPTAGYLDLAHVDLRERLGLLTLSVEEERATEAAAIDKVFRALAERGLLAPGADVDVETQVVALHRYLRKTPSRMLGVALADLVGDRRIINQPGTNDEYPNWRLPLAGPDGVPLSLDDVLVDPRAQRLAAVMSNRSEPGPPDPRDTGEPGSPPGEWS